MWLRALGALSGERLFCGKTIVWFTGNTSTP
jgi:hypothetical protein